jgi:hypothetical protein
MNSGSEHFLFADIPAIENTLSTSMVQTQLDRDIFEPRHAILIFSAVLLACV